MNFDFLEKPTRDSQIIRTTGFLLFILVVLVLFCVSTVGDLLGAVLRREGSSHGVFVPLLSMFFLWRKKTDLKAIRVGYGAIPGLALVAAGFLALFLSKTYGSFYAECFSLIVVLAGSITVFFGTGVLREVWFPIFFLVFMIPVPKEIYGVMADWVRAGTIETSANVLRLVGVPFSRQGLMIHLPNTVLAINIACSGMRYLLSYFVFGMAYSYLYRESMGQRILVVALTIPISLLASTLRLTVIVLLTYHVGAHMAEYRPHVITSWLVFVSVLVFFVGGDRWLTRKRAV